MRKLFIISGVVVAVIAGGYSTMWASQAHAAQHAVESTIADLNTAGGENSAVKAPLVRYESISTGGFPLGVTITVHKPVVNIPVTAILQSKKRVDGKPPADWTEEVSTDAITISQSAGQDAASVQFPDPITDRSFLDKQPHGAYIESDDDFTCHANIPKTLVDQHFTLSAVMKNDESLECVMKGRKLQDAASHDLLFTQDELAFSFGNIASSGPNHKLHIAEHSVNARTLPAGNAVFARTIESAIAASGGDSSKPAHLLHPSDFGLSNDEIDVRYDGPIDANALHDPALRLSLDVDTWKIKNDLWNASTVLHESTDESNVTKSDHLSMHSSMDVSERYDTLSAAMVDDPTMRAAIPHLHGLGTLTFDVDADGNVVGFLAGHTKNVSLKLADLSLNTTPYGLALKGELSHMGDQQSLDMTLGCRNCDRFIADLGGYALRVGVALPAAQRQQLAIVTNSRIESVRDFVHQLGTTSGPRHDTIELHFLQPASQPLTINGKSMMEIFMLLQSSFSTTQ